MRLEMEPPGPVPILTHACRDLVSPGCVGDKYPEKQATMPSLVLDEAQMADSKVLHGENGM